MSCPCARDLDSSFDLYRGVIAYLRVKEGLFPSRSKVRFMASAIDSEAEEAGVFALEATSCRGSRREVGYLVTGLKDVHQVKVGDTVTLSGKQGAHELLPGYREPRPMVWSGLFRRGRRLLGAAGGARPAEAERRGAGLRTRDVEGARLRVPGADSSACSTWTS